MDENELTMKIEIAKQQGLFNEPNTNNNRVFDCYGNYYFPTDFSIAEDNTILSVTRASAICLTKSR